VVGGLSQKGCRWFEEGIGDMCNDRILEKRKRGRHTPAEPTPLNTDRLRDRRRWFSGRGRKGVPSSGVREKKKDHLDRSCRGKAERFYSLPRPGRPEDARLVPGSWGGEEGSHGGHCVTPVFLPGGEKERALRLNDEIRPCNVHEKKLG